MSEVINGKAVSQGCGIGKAIIIEDVNLDYSAVKYKTAEEEKARLEKAVEEYGAKMRETAKKLKKSMGEKEAEILEGHIAMLSDSLMLARMNENVESGCIAEAAVDTVCTELYDLFFGLDDETMRCRASDFKDIKDNLLAVLLGVEKADIAFVPKGSVLIAKEFTPSIISRINKDNVSALVAEVGEKTSHSAILARAAGIPAVFSATCATQLIKNGDLLLVDGFRGRVLTNPRKTEIAEYSKKQRAYTDENEELKAFIKKPAVTKSGVKKEVFGNIGNATDVKSVIQSGGEGIGLFRTEFLFVGRISEPGEEEQFEAYSTVAKAMDGKEVIIRTFDIGGDKRIDYLKTEKEDNPLLGMRAIRYCLKNTGFFKTQLRALLRAAYFGNIKIMLPLISSLDEVRNTKALINECAAELDSESVPYRMAPLGIMIETPSAALISDLLAREVDFFSIGTNDLTGYTMAVDRGNAAVSSLYDTLNPAVLRAVEMTIKNAKSAGITVGMCGEAAADELLIPRLAEWGLDVFSVAPSSILKTKRNICKCE